jgi:hypothetical protein
MNAEIFQVGHGGIEQLKVLAHPGRVTNRGNNPMSDLKKPVLRGWA